MKITRPIRAVLFDMDGVMVDSEFVYMKYLLEFAKEKNPAYTATLWTRTKILSLTGKPPLLCGRFTACALPGTGRPR